MSRPNQGYRFMVRPQTAEMIASYGGLLGLVPSDLVHYAIWKLGVANDGQLRQMAEGEPEQHQEFRDLVIERRHNCGLVSQPTQPA